MREQFFLIFRKYSEESQLFRDLREHFGALMEQLCDFFRIEVRISDPLPDIGFRYSMELFRGESSDILGIEISQFLDIKDRR